MKRHKSLASLSSDHHHGLNIARMLRSTKRTNSDEANEAYKKLKDFFENELTKHFLEEEKYLVPYLDNNVLIKRMCEEHLQLRELFKSMNLAEDRNESLISFGKLLDSHIRFEERELFPMIENTLPEETLIEIGSRINAAKGVN